MAENNKKCECPLCNNMEMKYGESYVCTKNDFPTYFGLTDNIVAQRDQIINDIIKK